MYTIKKTYKDFNDQKRTEEFHFYLTKAEVVEWLSTQGDYTLDKVIEKLIKTSNVKDTIAVFKDLIYRSYGEISLDGRRFMKDETTKKNFVETQAFSDIFMEIASDGKKAAEFINGILPKELSEEIDNIIANNPDGIPDSVKEYLLNDGKPAVQ